MTPEEPNNTTPDPAAADDVPRVEVVDALEETEEEVPEYEVLDDPLAEPPEITEAREVTRARVRDLRTLLGKYVQRYLPEPSPPGESVAEPPRLVGSEAKALPLLRLIPASLAVLFALSFLWDFPGVTLSLFGYQLALDGLLRIVSVSGLIGFFTNWLAITMLFNPRHRRPILGQGLIPAQRERIIFRLAKAVSDELINEEIIKQKIEESGVIPKYREMAMTVTRGVLEDPDFRRELKQLTADYVDSVLASEEVRKKIVEFTVQKIEEYTQKGLSGLALKAYRFINEDDFQRRIDEAIQNLPTSLDVVLDEMDHLLDRLPEKIAERSDDIEQWATKIVLGFVEKLDVYSMIISNMRQYDEKKLEMLIKNSSNEQLNYIKYLGGLLGFFGGLVIWRPLLALGVFGVIGLALYALDETLYRARKRATNT
ncbi:MAG: DUF445 domain-containing protein [Rhodothermales bacterium]